jgi:hypothetical protein
METTPPLLPAAAAPRLISRLEKSWTTLTKRHGGLLKGNHNSTNTIIHGA